jgi:hypothetical protein
MAFDVLLVEIVRLLMLLLKVNNVSAIYSINLTTGAATKVSDINIKKWHVAVGLGFKSINVLN